MGCHFLLQGMLQGKVDQERQVGTAKEGGDTFLGGMVGKKTSQRKLCSWLSFYLHTHTAVQYDLKCPISLILPPSEK